LLREPLRDVGIVALVTRMDREVAVLRVASVADRHGTDLRRHDPVDEHGREQHRREPDPPDPPADEEREAEGGGHDQAAQALVEILLEEKRPVAAERARLDTLRRHLAREVGVVGAPALLAGERPAVAFSVLARRQAVGTVAPGAHAYAGNPVATVRYDDSSS